jgi:hypothetical protein
MEPPYDVYISADVETDGPIPGRFSMLSFGLAVAGRFDGTRFERVDPTAATFYRELRPVGEAFVPEALAVSGLDRERLLVEGAEPRAALTEAAKWVREVAGDGTPVLVAFPLGFDWSFLSWYFVAFAEGGSPFGHSQALDSKTLFAARTGRPIAAAGLSRLPAELRSARAHEHHALADAIEQADVFANLMELT